MPVKRSRDSSRNHYERKHVDIKFIEHFFFKKIFQIILKTHSIRSKLRRTILVEIFTGFSGDWSVSG